MKKTILAISFACIAVLLSCTPSIPTGATMSKTKAKIYPDYDAVTIPCNIAPMNFQIDEEGDDYITHLHTKGNDGIVVSGKVVDIDNDDWKALLSESSNITIDTYVKKNGNWIQFPAMTMTVAEPIDPYITYRLIEPSYVNFEVMSINQRCLEDFSEEEIFNTCTFATNTDGHCINCHVARNYNKDQQWQFHVRLAHGGTIIANGNKLKKVNLKTDATISAGVYPAWHPTLPLIAYSNNITAQIFHNTNRNKIEVQDEASDLILYDNENNTVQFIANDSTEWETFPNWSPDGKALYYVSATIPNANKDSIYRLKYLHPERIKYNIYKRTFNLKSRTFSEAEPIYMAAENNASAIHPRVSPDGRYLMFTQGEYGTFHIWHHDADLYLLDLQDNSVRPMTELNSADTESYHNWSSNGRWVLFSSRRDDGSYTRLYIAYFDKNGRARKPFLLPQKNPQSNILLLKSYNIPELLAEPVKINRNSLIQTVESEPLQPAFSE